MYFILKAGCAPGTRKGYLLCGTHQIKLVLICRNRSKSQTCAVNKKALLMAVEDSSKKLTMSEEGTKKCLSPNETINLEMCVFITTQNFP